MKILKRQISQKDGEGFIKLVPSEAEDMVITVKEIYMGHFLTFFINYEHDPSGICTIWLLRVI